MEASDVGLDMVRAAAFVLLLISCTDTEYAPAYSESGWESVRVGDSESALLRKLGPPLRVREIGTDVEGWLYSRSPSSTHYHYREVHVRSAAVIHIDAHFYVD